MISKLKLKFAQSKSKYPDQGTFSLMVMAFSGVIRMLQARLWLRKCDDIGSMVSAKKKPMIDNQGKLFIGDEVRIWSNIIQAKLLTGKNGILKIGQNSRINGAHIDAQTFIEIGENCRIAPYTLILDSNFHDVNSHFSDVSGDPIVIEDDVWITSRATILPGVRIGKGAVVATGAIVTKNVDPYTLVAGVPAREIKKLNKT